VPEATYDEQIGGETMTDTATTGVASSTATAPFSNGRSIGVGGLPHRDAAAAAAFSMSEFDIATVATLPRRSPAEAMIAQALVGLPGVSLGQYGSMAVDPDRVVEGGPIATDLDNDAFVGLQSFLDLAGRIRFDGTPLKWQFVGPVTLGVALQRAGLETRAAFDLAAQAVRVHVADISSRITAALPESPQLLLLDEPALVDLMAADFPIPPDEAVDLMSTAMAAVPTSVTTGLHCCGPCDVATMLTSGPQVVSIPAAADVVDWAGYIQRFQEGGGVVAWGVVHTDRPVPPSAERPWHALSDLWCELVQRGCEPSVLRRQSLVSPTCGLTAHSVSVGRRIARMTADVGRRVKDQANASRFALGA